jgi:hypothetical protein
MTADEVLANPWQAMSLPENAIVVSAVVVVEYVEPDSEDRPDRRRLAWVASEELNPWTSIGIWEFLKQREIAQVANFVEPTGDDDG